MVNSQEATQTDTNLGSIRFDLPINVSGDTSLNGAISQIEGTKRASPASPKDVFRYDNLGALRLAGACNGLDPNMFFPDESDGFAEEEAKAVCRNCVIRVACLEYSLEAREAYGIWGGATERDRRRILRQRSNKK